MDLAQLKARSEVLLTRTTTPRLTLTLDFSAVMADEPPAEKPADNRG